MLLLLNMHFVLKEPSGGPGCQENLCPMMRCRNQCCYDGCRSFCHNDDPEPFPVAVTGGPNAENICPMKGMDVRVDGCPDALSTQRVS